MAKKKTVAAASEPAKAGDISKLRKAVVKLRDEVMAKNWWGAYAAFQDALAELQAGLSDGVSLASDCSPKACCACLDEVIAELDNHDEKAAKAPAMAGGLFLQFLPVLLQVVQTILNGLKKE